MTAKVSLVISLLAIAASGRMCSTMEPKMNQMKATAAEVQQLPPPGRQGRMSLEEALARRRSVREFRRQSLTAQQLSQLLWAAQGTSHPAGYRTAPSAGALYPLELYVATSEGLFHYNSRLHQLTRRLSQDVRQAICRAALEQEAIAEAPAVFVFAAVYERTQRKYGEARTPRYVHMEVGHAAQNLLLQAVTLGLGGVPIGAFYDAQLQKVLSLPADHQPLYLVPVGYPRE